MKTKNFKTVFGSLAVAGALMMTPVATFALDVDLSQAASVRINNDGVVKVLGAEVTSVSGNIINAVTRFKNSVVNWAFTTNASTTIQTGGSMATSSSALRVGDKLHVTGALSAVGSTLSVTANKIVDVTSLAMFKTRVGTVQSVNTANGTFVLKTDDKLVTVTTNAQTSFKFGTTTASLATLPVNAKVVVAGTVTADGSAMTATSVVLKSEIKHLKKELKDTWKKDTHNNGKGRDDERHAFLKSQFGLMLGNR